MEILKKILTNKKVQAAFVALILAALSAFNMGCQSFGQLDPKAQRAVDAFDCYVGVLSPYTDEVLDTANLVRETISVKVDLGRTLALLGCAPSEVKKITNQL